MSVILTISVLCLTGNICCIDLVATLVHANATIRANVAANNAATLILFPILNKNKYIFIIYINIYKNNEYIYII